MSGMGLGALLVTVWLLLWGDLSVANVASGIIVAIVTLVFINVGDFEFRFPYIRPLPTIRLMWRIVADLLIANWVVNREILTRDSSINTGVVRVPMAFCSDGILTFVANVVALAPGTMAVEADREPAVLYIHVLHLDTVEEVRESIQDLAIMAVAAFGTPDAVAEMREFQRASVTAAPSAHPEEDSS